jgi:hypothetical protein
MLYTDYFINAWNDMTEEEKHLFRQRTQMNLYIPRLEREMRNNAFVLYREDCLEKLAEASGTSPEEILLMVSSRGPKTSHEMAIINVAFDDAATYSPETGIVTPEGRDLREKYMALVRDLPVLEFPATKTYPYFPELLSLGYPKALVIEALNKHQGNRTLAVQELDQIKRRNRLYNMPFKDMTRLDRIHWMQEFSSENWNKLCDLGFSPGLSASALIKNKGDFDAALAELKSGAGGGTKRIKRRKTSQKRTKNSRVRRRKRTKVH